MAILISIYFLIREKTCLLCYLALGDKHMNFIMMAKSVVLSWQVISMHSQNFNHVKSFFPKIIVFIYILPVDSVLLNALKILLFIFFHPGLPVVPLTTYSTVV